MKLVILFYNTLYNYTSENLPHNRDKLISCTENWFFCNWNSTLNNLHT